MDRRSSIRDVATQPGAQSPDQQPWKGLGIPPLGEVHLDTLLEELLDRVREVRASRERLRGLLDAVVSIGSDLDLQYQTTLSDLQDLDYNEAISRLTQQRTFLEAAQQSFLKTTGLSLFNYLS